MKRSEVIQIISNYLYELNVEPEDCDIESNKILKALEEVGMTPPDRIADCLCCSETGWEDET